MKSSSYQRDARIDWQAFAPDNIPTKEKWPFLETFLDRFPPLNAPGRRRTVLDLGCGLGRISRVLFEKGYNVTGIDINQAAIAEAKNKGSAGSPSHFRHFALANSAADPLPYLNDAPFDLIVGQLVISIIGDLRDRRQLLANAFQWLRPGGWLYLSASGVSDEINSNYARLYAQDEPLTGEPYSYFSRDSDGNILYKTHHFQSDELQVLLQTAGFNQITVNTVKEQSSRRPDQAAYFFYATCQRPIE
ncbi:MAG TPA: class I SAM-dependent methyltransferase [Thioploca sp.]|nr:MAG: hypothetical protein B6247_11255 [Beggiatoa sp. 4572_84]RKZ59329.1 MAG: hypothetical protein DRR08_14220 [Gammaproteobacteria bacterium]HDN25985.1 class I SAM-dependent methyltransferase [Thioploca sp.]